MLKIKYSFLSLVSFCLMAISVNSIANVSCEIGEKDFDKTVSILRSIKITNNLPYKAQNIQVSVRFDRPISVSNFWGRVDKPRIFNDRTAIFALNIKDLSSKNSINFGFKARHKYKTSKATCSVTWKKRKNASNKPKKTNTPNAKVKPKSTSNKPSSNSNVPSLPVRLQAQNHVRAKEVDDGNFSDKKGLCSKKGKADLTAIEDKNGKCAITSIEKNEWIEFDTDTNSAGTYDVTFRAAADLDSRNPKMSLILNGKNIKVVSIPKKGLEAFSNIVIRDVKIPSGENKIRVQFNASAMEFNYLDIADAVSVVGVKTAKPKAKKPSLKEVKVAACKAKPLQKISQIPTNNKLKKSRRAVSVAFEVRGDKIISKYVRNSNDTKLALKYWQRIITLMPSEFRSKIVQFNVFDPFETGDTSDNGFFSSMGNKNKTGRKGHVVEISNNFINTEAIINGKNSACAPLTTSRILTDWTLIHEIGHSYLLESGIAETFNNEFDELITENKKKNLPKRRSEPNDKDYDSRGQVRINGNFVTAYAEREGGDEEAAETFTAYILAKELPKGNAWNAKKIRFFHGQKGMPTLRATMRSGTK